MFGAHKIDLYILVLLRNESLCTLCSALKSLQALPLSIFPLGSQESARHAGSISAEDRQVHLALRSPLNFSHLDPTSVSPSRSGNLCEVTLSIKIYELCNHPLMDSGAQKTIPHMSLALMRAQCHIHQGEGRRAAEIVDFRVTTPDNVTCRIVKTLIRQM